jgi:hypothetical protein
MDSGGNTPGNPAIDEDFVVLAYGDGNPFVQALLYEATVNMKRI